MVAAQLVVATLVTSTAAIVAVAQRGRWERMVGSPRRGDDSIRAWDVLGLDGGQQSCCQCARAGAGSARARYSKFLRTGKGQQRPGLTILRGLPGPVWAAGSSRSTFSARLRGTEVRSAVVRVFAAANFRSEKLAYARIPSTTWASSTPVSLVSRPRKGKVKCLWSMPRMWSIVAWRSRRWTGFSAML